MKAKIIMATTAAFAAALAWGAQKPAIDASNDRVKTNLCMPYAKLGVIAPKPAGQTKNRLIIGCECLDRDYADYDEYKEYLVPLGINKIRLIGGWAKTEKAKGVYDFAWLDRIINDALARGLKVWLGAFYGNEIYEGGGTRFLKGGMPSSPEGKAAWNRWVEEMAKRYAGKVEWEMWNEPDINPKTTYADIADMNIRTAEIIKKYDPDAKISALSLAGLKAHKFEENLKRLHKAGKLGLFSCIAYHGYRYRPEESYIEVAEMAKVLAKYSKDLVLRQGENGAPSKGFLGGALSKHPWTEYTQAKWDLRRALGDISRGYESNVFSISDMNYGGGDAIKGKNVKGLLETDENSKVIKIKMAYYAVQNLASVCNILDTPLGAIEPNANYKGIIEAFAYRDEGSGLPVFTAWFGDAVPSNMGGTTPVDAVFKGGAKIKKPVVIDILSGAVFEIPEADISREGGDLRIARLPLYDSPMAVADESIVDYKK